MSAEAPHEEVSKLADQGRGPSHRARGRAPGPLQYRYASVTVIMEWTGSIWPSPVRGDEMLGKADTGMAIGDRVRPSAPPGAWRRWFHRWVPVFTLMLLASLLPELLTGSTPVPLLVTTPGGLPSLMALYGCGALLIRETSVRWKRGWVTVMPLGVAYGIVEEGFFAKTMVDPNQPMLGTLGVYGRWMGLNWIPVFAFSIFHSVFSIATQILLTDLIFPRTKGIPFLRFPGTTLALAAYAFISVVGYFTVDPTHYMPGPAVLGFLFAALGAFVLIARAMPLRLLAPRTERPDWTPRRFMVMGAFFMTGFFALFIFGPPFVPFPGLIVALYLCLVAATGRFLLFHAGWRDNEAHKLALVTGMVLFFVPLGVILEIMGDRGVLVAVGGVVVLLFRLRRRWPWTPFNQDPLPP